MKGKTILLSFLLGVVLPWSCYLIADRLQCTDVTETKPTEVELALVETRPTEETAASCIIPVIQANGIIEEMELETYLVGAVLGEMPASFELEALKAQAIAARTFALRRFSGYQKHEGGAVCCDAACCQAYCDPGEYASAEGLEKVFEAVHATENTVLTYQGELIEATYFSCSGGKTEEAVAVWGTDVPYLQSVDSPGEERSDHYVDTVTFSRESFQNCLGISLSGSPESWLGAVTYTAGGGVDTMEIGGTSFQGTKLRQLLGLRSTAFVMTAVGETVTVTTKGFGHRVGMSQYGADAMAVSGATYQQILNHYYPGTSLEIWQG